MSAQNSWHEMLDLNPTNLKDFFTRPGPSEKFDPLIAKQEELTRFGFPPRPEPEKDKKAYDAWQRQFGRAIKYVEPELREIKRGVHGPVVSRQLENAPVGRTTSPNWAGNICIAETGQMFNQINGLWTVPPVKPPFTGPYVGAGHWESSVWVGLDGYGSSDVFQAGTEQDVVGILPSCYVWTEWAPAPSVSVFNFPASPGDLIAVQLQILPVPVPIGFPIGQAFISNVTEGAFTSVLMLGPPNGGAGSFLGNSAEWIVEAPCISNCGTATSVLAALPYFGPVSFWFGVARDTQGNEVFGGNGYASSMYNGGTGFGRTGGGTGTVQAEEVADPLIFGVWSVPL
jgi:hypothetical protein